MISHTGCTPSDTCDPVCPRPSQICNFVCGCLSGFRPIQLQPSLRCEEINECLSQPCLYGATCVDKVNDYQCLCTQQFNKGKTWLFAQN